MESFFAEPSRPLSGFNFLEEALLPYHFHEKHGNFSPEFSIGDSHFPSSDMGTRVSSASSNLTIDGEGDLPSEYIDCSDSVFKYINEMLMEEDMAEKPCMFHDPLALQATEKSFHDVLCEGGHSPPSQSSPVADISDDSCSVISSDFGGNCLSSFTSFGNTADSRWTADTGGTRLSILQSPFPKDFVFQSTASSKSNPSADLQNKFFCSKETSGSSPNERLCANFFTNEAMQFIRKGEEEARRFLPKGNHLLTDIRRSPPNPTQRAKTYATAAAVLDKDAAGYSPPCGAGVKRHGREDSGSQEERSTKQLAPCMDETELSDMFDRVLLCGPAAASSNRSSQINQKTAESHGSSAESISCNVATANKDVVDLRTLLFNCAQAVSVCDLSIANQHLQRIRKYASPFGDGSQRLAHYFAVALEARMKGTGVETYANLASKRTSVVETLKAYQAYISVCPFQRFGIIFGNHMILGATENAKTIHIIDFGILYGFQWPAFIMCLARRAEPPLLRMTAIELPQQGLRPAEGVQQTCRRLEKYCKRFNVPFEYNAIAQKWETIRREDLKIREGEVVIVNCLFRFKNLFDETVTMNSPRDQVLNLVSKINPRLFVHSVVNGNYNGSLFVTRFREAFYHYSAVFDAFEAKLTRENPMRLAYEKEFFGREVMNVIACEDRMRLERPEGYRQWQTRSARAGLKQIPLDPVVVKKLNCKLKEGYHEDFVLDMDGDWMLQGWKGRILFASSCWVPK